MTDFFKKRAGWLKPVALILMLAIPFLMFAAAVSGAGFWLVLSLGLMAVNMLLVMISG
jgi:hypothetical protein